MHKLIEYIDNELMDMEHKAEKSGKLSMAEVEYMDKLAHVKKNLLKSDRMTDGEYSRDGRMMPYYDEGVSMARKRDSMGRYARTGHDMLVDELRDLMHDAKDEPTRAEFRKFIQKLESM